MSFRRYYNEDVVKGTTPTFGEDFSSKVNSSVEKIDTKLTLDDVDGKYLGGIYQFPTSQEIHIYSSDSLLKSEYSVPIKYDYNGSYPVLKITPELDLRNQQVRQGVYSINYNFLTKFVENCKIVDISGDRTEIRIEKKGTAANRQNAFEDLTIILSSNSVSNSFTLPNTLTELVLNFKENNLYNVISSKVEGAVVGEETITLAYPRDSLADISTTFVPRDSGVTSPGVWRMFIEVWNPAIGQTITFDDIVAGEATGRARKYMLKPNKQSVGDFIWEPGQITYTRDPNTLPFPKEDLDGISLSAGDLNNLRLTYKRYNTTVTSFDSFVVKLDRPLEAEYGINSNLDLDGRIYDSYIEKIIAFPSVTSNDRNDFSEPNYNMEVGDKTADGTNFQTFNSLLDIDATTSSQLINYYFSGSLGNIKLNIDYSDFTNFVHFSSATERVDNFVYKLKEIENYNTRISTLEVISGSSALVNISQSIIRRDRVIAGFDNFENYLYYDTTSNNYTHWSSSAFNISPYPKTNIFPHLLHETTSSQGESWYSGVYSSASLYDEFNDARLRNMIPIHLQEDERNAEYITFVDMIGQHFDIQWTYINSLTDINRREEHPKDGMADDILKSVAESMGWKLANGYSDTSLWEYVLGVEDNGTLFNTGSLQSKSRQQIVHETWRRIVNNLPMLYKTKGTARSIKAILATYGIPQAFLKIREWGGPTVSTRKNVYEHERFVNKLELSPSKHLTAPWDDINSDRPNSIEIIGKMPQGNYHVARLSDGSDNVDYFWDYNISNKTARIRLSINGSDIVSSSFVPYNTRRDAVFTLSSASININSAWIDDWGNLLANPTASLLGNNSTFNTVWNSAGSLLVPGPTTDSNIFNYETASIQEVRYYRDIISNEIVIEHAKNREAYFSDDNTTELDIDTSYDKLMFRIFPDSEFQTTSSYIRSRHPNQKITQTDSGFILSASFTNLTPTQLVGEVDTQFVTIPSVGALNLMNNKIRIESASLKGPLNPDKSNELSEFDYAPIDSNLLGTYFSTTDTINFDIYNSEGYFEADDWIGDPDKRSNDGYPLLKYRAKNYFQKYNLFTAIDLIMDTLSRYDMSVFTQIQQLIPARADWHKGILIEPHILERNKYRRNGDITFTKHMFDGKIQVTKNTLSAFRNDLDVAEIDLYDYLPSVYKYQIATLSSSISCSIISNSTIVSASVLSVKLNAGESEFIYQSSTTNASNLSHITSSVLWIVEENFEEAFNGPAGNSISASVDSIDVNTSTINLLAGYVIADAVNGLTKTFILSSTDNTNEDVFGTFTSSSIQQSCVTTSTFVDRSNGHWQYSPTGSTVLKSRLSKIYQVPKYFYSTDLSASLKLPNSSSMEYWHGQDDRLPLSLENLFYNGCKITSDSLTTDSLDTPDGGPVVEITIVDPNVIIYSTQTISDSAVISEVPIGTSPVRITPTNVLIGNNTKRTIIETSSVSLENDALRPLKFIIRNTTPKLLLVEDKVKKLINKLLKDNNEL